MSDLTFIKNLPFEFTGYHYLPANTRYPCDWGYNRQTEVKQVYRVLQLIGNGEYIFLVTDNEFSYWGHSDKFETANKLGQDYGQEVKEPVKSFIGTIKNQSLREQVLDASAKILQYSLGNITFKTEGLHPISDTTIHIQCDGCVVDISFWCILGAFRNPADDIDEKLVYALFHHGKITGEKMNSVELIRNVFCFTI